MISNGEGSSHGRKKGDTVIPKKKEKSVTVQSVEKLAELAEKAGKSAAKVYKDHKDKGKVKPYNG